MKNAVVFIALLPFAAACWLFPTSTIAACALILWGCACILRYRLGATCAVRIKSFLRGTYDPATDESALSKQIVSAFSVMWAVAAVTEAGAFLYLKSPECPQLCFLLLLGAETLAFLKRKARA